jgi:hypothetical protein
MRRYEPLPMEHVREFRQRLGMPTVEELSALLGPPAHELGPGTWTAESPGEPVETTHHTKILVFFNVTPLIKTLLVHVREDGRFDWEFRGKEITEAVATSAPQSAG